VKQEQFAKNIVRILAERAGNHCSNPDCRALTVGPASDASKSVLVGEAAHIYGAKPQAARYRESMTPAQRGLITNAVWLCRICHKKVDADADMYSADLLFEWRNAHERWIADQLGRPGEAARLRVMEKQLEPFSHCSYLARQLIADKPKYWEYLLIAELLRDKLEPIKRQWQMLEGGFCVKSITRIPEDQFLIWTIDRMTELQSFAKAVQKILSERLTDACGPPGRPGSPVEILRACTLLEEICLEALRWEERVRFAAIPELYDEIRTLFVGSGGRFLMQVDRISGEIASLFSDDIKPGSYHINIVFDLPPNWNVQMSQALDRIRQSLKV
jgi:hypothetical protein